MKNTTFILFLSLYSLAYNAQNLVPNPSFESYTTCPNGLSQINYATSWNTPTLGTPDYMNNCAPTGFFSVCIPTNFRGYQNARTGVGYANIFTLPTVSTGNYREYLQANLTSPLVAGTIYEVSFYVSLSDKSRYATNNLGAYLSVNPINSTNTQNLPYIPQINEPNIITDTANWTLVTGLYIAGGGEEYITIGNFYNDVSTLRTLNNAATPNLFSDNSYYIDDVSVIEAIALPVELLNFTGYENNQKIELLWETASETNNDYFTIYRSNDGVSFKPIGKIEGAGNSSQYNSYQFTDKNPSDGINYYLLKQTDFDGKFSTSDVIAINFNKLINEFIIYPNPVNEHLTINLNNSQTKLIEYSIINTFGEIVINNKIEGTFKGSYTIDVRTLKKGIYYILINTENERLKAKKFIKN